MSAEIRAIRPEPPERRELANIARALEDAEHMTVEIERLKIENDSQARTIGFLQRDIARLEKLLHNANRKGEFHHEKHSRLETQLRTIGGLIVEALQGAGIAVQVDNAPVTEQRLLRRIEGRNLQPRPGAGNDPLPAFLTGGPSRSET